MATGKKKSVKKAAKKAVKKAVKNLAPLQIAALRGRFGKWAFYSVLMPLQELVDRVEYAEELHTNKRLAEMIQRRLKAGRGKEVATYLKTVEDRFFNAIVVAVYKGDPRWYQLKLRSAMEAEADLSSGDIDPSVAGGVGVLVLSGKERLFALDGQHRLAGLRIALTAKTVPADDEIAVVCVAHSPDPAGMIRTRRLFTTLNKKAKPVAMADIIALDEDDVAAICARRLVDEYQPFKGKRISVKPVDHLDETDAMALTSIKALYTVCKKLFRGIHGAELRKYGLNRPPDDVLDKLYKEATAFFVALAEANAPVGEFFEADDTAPTVKKYRASQVLFRPLGLALFAEVVASCAARRKISVAKAVGRVAKAPLKLTAPPFRGVLWSPATKKIVAGNRRLARDLLALCAGEPSPGIATLQQEVDDAAGAEHTFDVSKLAPA